LTKPRYRGVWWNGRRMDLHRKRAEQALGHPLPPKACVHHADGTKGDHSPLVICQNAAYHRLLHARMRIKAAGGNPNTDRICTCCHAVKPLEAFYGQRDACKICSNRAQFEWLKRNRARLNERHRQEWARRGPLYQRHMTEQARARAHVLYRQRLERDRLTEE
jgi:hypothetical protein